MDTFDMRAKTVGGLLAYADWLEEKGYQSRNAMTAWRTAVTKVFEAVGGEDWKDSTLVDVDLDDLGRRFHTLTGNTYKSETVAVYKRRIQNAIDAQTFFIENDRPPSFRKQSPKPKVDKPAVQVAADEADHDSEPQHKTENVTKLPQADFFEFAYPLSPGRMVRMELPFQMSKREIDRLCTVLQTLEEQPQLMEQNAA